MNKVLNEQQIKSICDVLGHTSNGLTKSELTHLIQQCNITVVEDGSSSNGYTYTIGLNKSKWLFNCFAGEINKNHSFGNIFNFVEKAMNPISYVNSDKRSKYDYMFEEINKVLLFIGAELSQSGKIREVIKAESLDEVDRRVNNLRRQFYIRAIHPQVQKYCIEDYLRKDYFDAVFEAAKGLAQRVREITGLKTDGSKLFQEAFSKNNPYIFFNKLQTESEINEHNGLRELLEAVFHMVRNQAAHTPKINWNVDESKALDILTIISFAHKYLDECHKNPAKSI